MQRADDRQPSYEFRYEAILDEILRLRLGERFSESALSRALYVRVETESFLADPLLNHFLQADEGAAAEKQDICGVDGEKLLVGMLAAALRRNICHRAFQNLEQGLLNALARDVAGNGGVFILAANLVYFVYVDDAGLGAFDVA